jgi:hypothetical protein
MAKIDQTTIQPTVDRWAELDRAAQAPKLDGHKVTGLANEVLQAEKTAATAATMNSGAALAADASATPQTMPDATALRAFVAGKREKTQNQATERPPKGVWALQQQQNELRERQEQFGEVPIWFRNSQEQFGEWPGRCNDWAAAAAQRREWPGGWEGRCGEQLLAAAAEHRVGGTAPLFTHEDFHVEGLRFRGNVDMPLPSEHSPKAITGAVAELHQRLTTGGGEPVAVAEFAVPGGKATIYDAELKHDTAGEVWNALRSNIRYFLVRDDAGEVIRGGVLPSGFAWWNGVDHDDAGYEAVMRQVRQMR